jgi:thiol:disulfide interchange protein
MHVTASSNRRTPIFLTLSLAASISFMAGCRNKQPSPEAAPPVATAPATPPARQPVTPVPAVKKHLYPANVDAKAEIAAALKQARHEHKRVILSFGGDWCGDCQVLDIYFHQSPNDQLLANNFLVVHVDIGHFDKNADIAETYKVPLKQGVPALAVIDADGKLLYSQTTGEFGDMRYMHASSVTDFLTRWKA